MIRLTGIKKTYARGDSPVHALAGVDLNIAKGEFVAVMGASGSGKSTLMNILGCLDRPTSGEYLLNGIAVAGMSRNELAAIRNDTIGFVFQGFNLLARTNAVENVELPLLYNRSGKRREVREKALAALGSVGLAERINHEPTELSGGQQQRIAIARALVNNPKLLLADEPTGNLDTATSLEIMAIFRRLNETDITVVLVTHEIDIAAWTRRLITMRDGAVIEDRLQPVRPATSPERTAA